MKESRQLVWVCEDILMLCNETKLKRADTDDSESHHFLNFAEASWEDTMPSQSHPHLSTSTREARAKTEPRKFLIMLCTL
jgi:hypothetical protein